MARHSAEDLIGHHVLDDEGNNIGKIGQVYLDDQTGVPTWASVNTGLFGMRETLVPLQGARPVAEDIQVPYDKATVKDAPNIEAKDHISRDEEQQVRDYYAMHGGIPGQTRTEGMGTEARPGSGRRERTGRQEGRTRGGADDEVVYRTEEQVDVGVERREGGQARMRKHIDREQFDETVPVSHEELEVERRPVTDASQVGRHEPMEEGEETFTLYEERPVVSKKEVPVEEIHLRKKRVTRDEHVQGERRSERIEFEGEDEEGRGGRPPRS